MRSRLSSGLAVTLAFSLTLLAACSPSGPRSTPITESGVYQGIVHAGASGVTFRPCEAPARVHLKRGADGRAEPWWVVGTSSVVRRLTRRLQRHRARHALIRVRAAQSPTGEYGPDNSYRREFFMLDLLSVRAGYQRCPPDRR